MNINCPWQRLGPPLSTLASSEKWEMCHTDPKLTQWTLCNLISLAVSDKVWMPWHAY